MPFEMRDSRRMKRFGDRGRALRALALSVLLLPATLLMTSCVYWTPRSHAPTASAKIIENVPTHKWDIKSCGAGALSSVLQHYGDPVTMAQWDAELPKTRGGVMSIDLVLAARERGFDANLVTGDASLLDAELEDGRPVILMLQVIQAPGKGYDFFHYIVIDGYDAERKLYRTQFGDGKSRWARLERLEPAWKPTRYATVVIRPADPNAKALRAAVQLEEQNNLGDAAQAYRDILSRDPRSLLAWTNLGNVEMRAGNTAAAEAAFRKALELDADAADTLNNLAWLLYEQKRVEEAEPLARRAALTKAPDAWMRLDTLARILTARGNCDEAKKTFDAALAQVPASRSEERSGIEQAAHAACGG
jgi:TolA-binding protein